MLVYSLIVNDINEVTLVIEYCSMIFQYGVGVYC